MSRIAKLIASACALSLMLVCLGGCAPKTDEGGNTGTEDPGTNTAGAAVGTPMYQVDTLQEILDTFKAPMFLPGNAQAVTYYIYNDDAGNPSFAEAQYLLGDFAYSQRLMPADSVMPELPGMYFDWTTTTTVVVNDTEVALSYSQDGPGQAVWYDSAYGTSNSITVTTGASEEALTQVVTEAMPTQM